MYIALYNVNYKYNLGTPSTAQVVSPNRSLSRSNSATGEYPFFLLGMVVN